jgi:starch phosphorylase
MATDVVCGMEVAESTAPASAEFHGAVYRFCSPSCKAAFVLAAAEYVGLASALPPRLRRLRELARDVWWSWHPEARALFRELAPGPEEPLRNPLEVLLGAGAEALHARARDRRFVSLYDHVMAAFDADVRLREGLGGSLARGPAASAMRPLAAVPLHGPIAYFCAEFGLHGTLPIYSGGLGILAGDIVKEASDLRVPIIGVGFMYPQGYFRQRVSADGRQEERHERINRALAPVEPACTVAGQPCVVALPMPDHPLHVSVWVVRVGSVRLYLMDTDLEANSPADREISGRLYQGDQELRLRQEIVLGIGGVRLLRALGIAPSVWHANEGHSAFMMVERLRELIEDGAPLMQAVERVQASTVFTTHTPVPAGHDAFPFSLVEKYLASYWPTLGLDRDWFLGFGAHDDGEGRRFNMTALALRLSGHRTAVSRRHAEVSRRMWRSLWPGTQEERVPIEPITNGVHVPSWVAPELDRLYRAHLGEDWVARHADPHLWAGIEGIPDAALWQAHQAAQRRMLDFIRYRARRQWAEGRTPIAAGVLLEPAVLTLGFARRFATYKRASLILRDRGRLRALLTDARRPVQIVFAGKAHPADEPAKQILQAVYRAGLDPGYAGRIAFVEDYDMEVARHLIAGVDVWLNTPRPPLEASGTSGQKAAVNGVPSLSALDGWWAEGYDGANGWAIGDDQDGREPGDRDAQDAGALYRLLETVIVPLYYERDDDGLPVEWVRLMKRAIQTLAPRFSTRRLLTEYVVRLYAAAGAPR